MKHWLMMGVAMAIIGGSAHAAKVNVWPAPTGEELSKDFKVSVEGKSSPVYIARVASADQDRRWKAMDDKANSGNYYEKAAYTTFDMSGTVRVVVTCPNPVTSAKLLPSSFKIAPTVRGNTISFRLSEPKPLTLEVNGDWVHSLHLFANPLQTDVPKPDDPNVIYYGPGVHEVSRLVVGAGKTLYLAGGAILRGVIKPEEPFSVSTYSGLKNYAPMVELNGDNITLRGRGVIDGNLLPTHSRHLLYVHGKDLKIEGIILHNSPTWNLPLRGCDRVNISNFKIIGSRANSDGIDVCNSRDVTIEKCFLRTLDDLIVLKTDKGQGLCQHVVARDCVLWNEVAHALSIGAELSENVDDVLFTNCDVIHDKGREWTLRIYHCDAGKMTNVRFENIRIEEAQKLISLWIDKAYWTRDPERGHIDGVTFRNITATTTAPRIEFKGFDATHLIENVVLQNVVVNGKKVTTEDVKCNEFVKGVSVRD